MNLSDDDFKLFGLPQRYAIDRADVDERWRALQASAHPDRFSAQGAASQRLAMQWTMRINEAHHRLKDPLKRAAYLCELRGAPLDAEHNTKMPPAFLLEQMTWREALEEADQPSVVKKLSDEVAAREAAMFEELRMLLDDRNDVQAAVHEVRALMFVARLRAELDRRLDALGQ